MSAPPAVLEGYPSSLSCLNMSFLVAWFEVQDFCQVCWDGGDLVCCDRCPAAYHPDCLGLPEEQLQSAPTWSCPQHACAVCQKKAQVGADGERGGVCGWGRAGWGGGSAVTAAVRPCVDVSRS